MASLHNGSKLKTAAKDVIVQNYQTIRESQEWAQLEEESNAAREILDHVMKYKSNLDWKALKTIHTSFFKSYLYRNITWMKKLFF